MQRRTLLASLAACALPAPAARAAAGFVTTRDNQRLAYIDRGAGKPVVFIHGWSLGSAIWTLQTDWLVAQGLRVIAYDRQRQTKLISLLIKHYQCFKDNKKSEGILGDTGGTHLGEFRWIWTLERERAIYLRPIRPYE